MLEVENLGVGYGDLQVVWDVSFEVPAGSIVAIIGPNGAGKTTTLRALMNLLPLMSGSVAFKGESIVGVPTHEIVERGLVLIPESRATFSSLTVADNLELGAYTKRARSSQDATLRDVYDIFPRLAERKAQLAGTLSGGERQMLAIGKALMALPEMLVLDEPSLGLAPLIVESTFAEIRDIRERGVSVLMVEQHVEMTLEVVDFAYVLELGHVVTRGSSGELMQDPRVRDAYLSLG
jgi:branched-chain amino acid transport system ATP-binding protein